MTALNHQIIVVGGGAAGITVAAQLLKQQPKLDLAIVEPCDKHYYQPAWTLVGGGAFAMEDTIKAEQDCIPSGAKWIKASVASFDPDNNSLTLQDGRCLSYEYLVVCPGIQINWHLIPGLQESLGKNGVTSNYDRRYAPYTWELLQNFKGGNALFTFPATPIKCAGAPQKIMYLADETFRKNGVRDKTTITYGVAVGKIFGIPGYCESLEKVAASKDIDVRYHHNLKAINPDTKEATFTVNGETEVTLPYDIIHVAPPMAAPDFIKNSPLAAATGGWVDVDKFTLQHNRYSNVFSLGDASSLPTSRTAAAVRKQAPVVATNLLGLLNSKQPTEQYGGYTCCPLVTGYGKTIMAEFDYDGQPKSSFPFDPTQERWSMWLVKRHVLPWLYWNRMLKGEAFEPDKWKPLLGKS
ncbi:MULTISPECIES: NAD(P)/FAD-dependent oxidoreductase [Synechocystis]|uniref:NAD(P)/FAD-dependent oxidoreductase n=1 Tax=Synechocystis salina LEGE 00031 TaxID=1828736 RepID=A0ABR9VP17_9SYNC|nr:MULTISPECIES: FAD/NAD(P)-binding oxidoreductase [Synechocystis]MBE9195339.1 NAD(P)/FAD-dependent oxidoreductase [Synechocystis sp. LEGE 06083]MBE9241049.1 NAD(P)/FAD-dependent oxidoreductase [Synechocystis salina LEGE 00041]MBE9253102.1 NAD(P)/FAD-dependent oxidoreductase [Synechocystis salina LEGE 00031]